LLGALAAGHLSAASDRGHRAGPVRFVARLLPVNEVPALSTPGRGSFTATIDEPARTISYELRYDGLDTTVLQAHVHTAQRGVNGGIMIWLCGSASLPGPAGTPICAATPGTIAGEVSADQVVGPAAQGISPGEFEEVVRAIRSGVAYANVHTTQFPSGEIRGQLRREWSEAAEVAAAPEAATAPPAGAARDDSGEVVRTAASNEFRGRSM
jgi:hypothetical protein